MDYGPGVSLFNFGIVFELKFVSKGSKFREFPISCGYRAAPRCVFQVRKHQIFIALLLNIGKHFTIILIISNHVIENRVYLVLKWPSEHLDIEFHTLLAKIGNHENLTNEIIHL